MNILCVRFMSWNNVLHDYRNDLMKADDLTLGHLDKINLKIIYRILESKSLI